jgi:hypothetical protein
MASRFNEWLNGLSPGRTSLGIAAFFAVAHGAYYAWGIRFDGTPLLWFWQYLDPRLLEGKLLESVFYMHSQPPLFNLFLGAVLKLSGGDGRYVFQGAYLAAGLTLYLSLFWLQVKLGVARGVAFATSTLFMLSPSFVLYEHWLFYTFPVAALITLSAFLFYEVVTSKRAWAAAAFFATLFLICGIRHVFHLAYYVVVAAALAFFCAGARRKVLLAAAVPFAVLFSFYAKNYALFGQFSASSWGGMYLWEMTGYFLSPQEREKLEGDAKLSPVTAAPTFSGLGRYPAAYAGVGRFGGVDALTQVNKSTGPNNYNHLGYVAISREYLNGAWAVLRYSPRAYLRGLLRSWFIYFRSSSDYASGVRFLDEAGNQSRISCAERFYDYLFYGRVPLGPPLKKVLARFDLKCPPYAYLYLVIWLPVLAFYGFRLALRRGAAAAVLSRGQRLTVLYLCVNVIYVTLAGTAFNWAESNRMRFLTDPLYVALLGVFIQHFLVRSVRSSLGR